MFRKLFKNLKLFQKILLVALATIVLMWGGLVYVAVSSIQDIYDKKIDRIISQTVEQTSKYVSTELSNIINLIHYSAVGEEIQEAIRLDVTGSNREYLLAQSRISPVLTQLQIQNEFIESTGMILKGKWFYGDNYPMSYDAEEMIRETKLRRLIYWSDVPVMNRRSGKEVLPVILRVPNGSFSAEHEAYMVVNIEAEKLFGYMEDLEKNLECSLILHNGDKIIYGDEELWKEREASRYFLNDTKIRINGWTISCIMDKEAMYADRNAAVRQMFAISAGIAVICFGLAYYISRSMVIPLAKLRDNAKAVERGELSVRNHFSGLDEIGDLVRSFDSMCMRLEEYIAMLEEEKRQVQISEKQKRQAEMRVLQAQINPHFLYNTLDSLYWYSLSGKKAEIGQIVVDLSDMLRIGLSKGAETIPVEHEVRHVEDYLKIQKTIFSDKFDYEMDISTKINGYRIIKILLQPLAENSLVHGFGNMEQGGFIRIYGGIEDGEMVFRVTDNGCGFEGAAADKKTEFSGYALGNIEDRLRLHYEEDASLHVSSRAYEETTVEIRIALKRLK